MSAADEKNAVILMENQRKLSKRIGELEASMKRLESHVALLQAEISNTKQVIGHTMGRGLGSTVQ